MLLLNILFAKKCLNLNIVIFNLELMCYVLSPIKVFVNINV